MTKDRYSVDWWVVTLRLGPNWAWKSRWNVRGFVLENWRGGRELPCVRTAHCRGPERSFLSGGGGADICFCFGATKPILYFYIFLQGSLNKTSMEYNTRRGRFRSRYLHCLRNQSSIAAVTVNVYSEPYYLYHRLTPRSFWTYTQTPTVYYNCRTVRRKSCSVRWTKIIIS